MALVIPLYVGMLVIVGWRDAEEIGRILDQASHAVQFSRELLQTTLDSLPQGVCVVDGESLLEAWNACSLDLLGLPGEAMAVGRPLADLLAQGRIDHHDPAWQRWQRAQKGHQAVRVKTRATGPPRCRAGDRRAAALGCGGQPRSGAADACGAAVHRQRAALHSLARAARAAGQGGPGRGRGAPHAPGAVDAVATGTGRLAAKAATGGRSSAHARARRRIRADGARAVCN